ncbi:hypothetical protein O3U67_15775 [Brevundimonas diminuta]|uniref:hypothetical protein n=1 Tax=Brevundimonas diminuta TaxID=293 RepID=UPI0022B078C5|nr:hypothetical protein [Brevundimonas diminuta]MCZ4109549.1 hypothetical protein [Brevundimonas diminuta]
MVERITLAQQHAVNEQRRMGRTDRQAEKIVGLPSGILSRRFIVVDDTRPVRLAFAESRTITASQRRRFSNKHPLF